MLKKVCFLFVLSSITLITYSQEPAAQSAKEQKKQERKDRMNKLMKEYEEGSLIYSQQSAIGGKLNTDGWGVFYEHGKYKTINQTTLWWVELGERKSHKEEKVTTGQDIGGGFVLVGNPYIFGKINNFYYLKGGFGQQRLIGGKNNKNGVAVSAVYGGGISLGYLKPYYITVQDQSGNNTDIKYSDSTASQFLDPNLISGGAGITKGFGQGKFTPGAFGRLALRFDYGRYNEFLSAVEVGVNAEYYAKKMPIIINNPERQFFFNGYIAVVFGKRK